MKIALGTVQFGLDYGVANRVGRPSFEDVRHILQRAFAKGVDTLDTAVAYGESEKTLGQAGVVGWNVVTKLPQVPAECLDIGGWVETQVKDSLQRLGVSQVYAVLLHRPLQLLNARWGQSLFDALQNLKEQGVSKKIGISVYEPEELEALWTKFKFDIVQAPLNIIDRRLINTGWLTRMHHAGTEVHVRSVFLQGLLLMNAAGRSRSFGEWQDLWTRWDNWLERNNLSPLQACLGFALSWTEIDRVVVGVDNLAQLEEVLSVSNLDSIEFPSNLESNDSLLINPSKWSRQ